MKSKSRGPAARRSLRSPSNGGRGPGARRSKDESEKTPLRAARLAPSAADLAAITPARVAALSALAEVAHGAPADDALGSAATSLRVSPADRALAHELVYGVLRARRRLDSILARHARSGLPKEGVLDAMRVGAYSLLWLDRVPAHAAVSTAVEAVKRGGAEYAAKFVNASLRQVARDTVLLRAERPPARDASVGDLGTWYSFPDWMVASLRKAAGPERIGALLAALNEAAPLCLRARDPVGLLATLAAAGFDAQRGRFAPECVVIPAMRGFVPDLPGFAEGNFAIQDEAAQMITEILDPREGEALLDVCAAPGGKAIHAAQRGARVTAVDADPHRLTRVRESAARLRVDLTVIAEEVAAHSIGALDGALFPKVLVDAPCSGTGIIRRKPDAKWARNAGEIARLAARQSAILEGASRHVAPGGLLVYAVCSLLPDEGEAVVEKFLSANGERFRAEDLRVLPRATALEAFRTPSGWFRSWPDVHGTDGFFAAAMRRI